MANRNWVDFRDPRHFDQQVAELVFGITGRREGELGSTFVGGSPRDDSLTGAPEPAPAIDEVACLGREIARTQAVALRLRRTRFVAPLPGAAVFVAFQVLTPAASGLVQLAVLIVVPTITALVGWGFTAPALRRCERQLEQLQLLHDGLEACRRRTIPGCSQLREAFWQMLLRRTGNIAV